MEQTTVAARSTLWAASCARSGPARLHMSIPERPKTIQTLASATTTIVEILLAFSPPLCALLPTQKSYMTIVNLRFSIQGNRS